MKWFGSYVPVCVISSQGIVNWGRLGHDIAHLGNYEMGTDYTTGVGKLPYLGPRPKLLLRGHLRKIVYCFVRITSL